MSTTTDETQLWEAHQADPRDQSLRNRLVEHYLPIVKHIAQRLWGRLPNDVDQDDLISAGVFGLIDAIKAFEPSRGVQFKTYCVQRIRGAMLDELRATDWVPRLVRSKSTKLSEAVRLLEAQHGRPPTERELAQELNVSDRQLQQLRLDTQVVNQTSLDKARFTTEDGNDLSDSHILHDEKSEDPTRRTQKYDLMRLVTKGLTQNERLIMILYYYEELTMKEIGATLGLSESRVSQVHSAIVDRLRTQLGQRRLEFAA